MSDKSYLTILKGGILASFVMLLFVFSSFLFPFITSKQLPFNILMEVLLAVYIIFLIQYPKYSPKKSHISFAVLAYFITVIISLFVSVDFNLSFWGDIERMLGFFHLLHFFIFYIITISVFKSKQDFKLLFNILISSALLVALYALIKHNPDSTIGNRAYVAAMMLFALFLQFMYLLKSPAWWTKILYGLGIVLAFVGFIKADISGSQAGLILGILTSLLVFVISSKNKKLKVIGISSLALFVVAVVALFALRSNPVFDNTYLGKSLRDFSSQNTTLNTRLISYQSAFKYLADNPVSMIFGVGHGNYALIFDKYFSARFYDYDRGATYFDRAHNTVIDILTTTGIIGLLAYLSIFVFVIWFLILAYRKRTEISADNRIGQIELSLLLGLLVAYFVQNLAVFDSFATYLYFFSFLAYMYFIERSVKSLTASDNVSLDSKDNRKLEWLKNTGVIIIFILIIFSISKNISAMSMIEKTIKAYAMASGVGIVEANEKYEAVFAFNSGLERDARESFVNLALDKSSQILKHKDQAEAKKTVEMLIAVGEKNLSYNQYDSLMLMRLSKVYDFAARFAIEVEKDSAKASEYANLSLLLLDRAIESSPGRVPLYLSRSNILLNFAENEKALADMKKALDLNPKMPDAYCQMAHYYFLQKDHNSFTENLSSCAEKNGLTLLNWKDFLAGIEYRYYEDKELNKLLDVYKILLPYQSSDPSLISKMALIYYESGDLAMAEKTANILLEIDPSYQSEVSAFIEQLKNGKK